MKNRNSFDKTGLIMGVCVCIVGLFVDPLVIVLGSLMAVTGITAYLAESIKSNKYMTDEEAEELFFSEVVQKASKIPIR